MWSAVRCTTRSRPCVDRGSPCKLELQLPVTKYPAPMAVSAWQTVANSSCCDTHSDAVSTCRAILRASHWASDIASRFATSLALLRSIPTTSPVAPPVSGVGELRCSGRGWEWVSFLAASGETCFELFSHLATRFSLQSILLGNWEQSSEAVKRESG